MASKRSESPVINKRVGFKAEVLQATVMLARERELTLKDLPTRHSSIYSRSIAVRSACR